MQFAKFKHHAPSQLNKFTPSGPKARRVRFARRPQHVDKRAVDGRQKAGNVGPSVSVKLG
jgi:hypothetical protein